MTGSRDVAKLQLDVERFDEATQVADRVWQRLKQRHPESVEYSAETMASCIVATNRILGGVSVIGIVAASISLLVWDAWAS